MDLRDTGELVGSCGVRVASNYPGTPVQDLYEIGWRIAESHWGQGLALEAARASLAWIWRNTSAGVVVSFTTADNVRSWRLMEKLGMSRRQDMDFVSDGDPRRQSAPQIVYAVERPEPINDGEEFATTTSGSSA